MTVQRQVILSCESFLRSVHSSSCELPLSVSLFDNIDVLAENGREIVEHYEILKRVEEKIATRGLLCEVWNLGIG